MGGGAPALCERTAIGVCIPWPVARGCGSVAAPRRPARTTQALGDCVSSEGTLMAIGPVQLIVLGFKEPEFHGEIIEELERLRESGTVRVIDALAVYKDAEGEIEVLHLSNLSKDEAIELGSKVGALVGLGIEGEEGLVAGAEAGAAAGADGGSGVSGGEGGGGIGGVPNDSPAGGILLGHPWGGPL